jgi:crotonobetainyl-CoA:carnitine CoA-transferase CaiB-like acyl-CoA transferase
VTSPLLAGVRVVDLTNRFAHDCGRFLASMGAEVIRVDLPGAAEDLRWRIGNVGKQCIAIDYRDDGAGRETLRELIGKSDILIDSFGETEAAALGLERGALSEAYPRLITVSITPFGRGGPRGEWRGGELTVSAMGSTLASMGDPDRPPIKEPLDACYFHACGAAAAGAMMALYERERSGRGQHVDISAQEVAAGRNTVWVMIHQFDGRQTRRSGQALNLGAGANRMIWPLADGHAMLALGPPNSPTRQGLIAWMEARGFDPAGGEEAFLRTIPTALALREGLKHGVSAMPILQPSEVPGDRHLGERGFFADGPEQPGRWFVHTTCEGAEG